MNSLTKTTLASALTFGALTFPAVASDTIKIGVLHSLSGTMAISETTLKDTMLMLIDEQNAAGGVLGCSSRPSSSIRPPTGRCLPKRRASC